MISGIYAILNIVNGKYYIGNSCNIAHRWKHHRYYLRSKNHYNEHLQRAWNKYGEFSFIFVVLEYTIELENREQYWIDALKCFNPEFGYNHRKIATSNVGIIFSEETRKRMSIAFKSRKISEENKRKISKALTGRKHTDETKAKMSASRKGRKPVNKKPDKWPHENGRRCKCNECRLKKCAYAKEHRAAMIGSWI